MTLRSNPSPVPFALPRLSQPSASGLMFRLQADRQSVPFPKTVSRADVAGPAFRILFEHEVRCLLALEVPSRWSAAGFGVFL